MTESVLIVGGGPVGATLALTLQYKGIAATMLEARAKGAAYQDQRALALSYGSRAILEKLGFWKKLERQATAINTIHISQRGSFGRSWFAGCFGNRFGALGGWLCNLLGRSRCLGF